MELLTQSGIDRFMGAWQHATLNDYICLSLAVIVLGWFIRQMNNG